MKKIEREKTLWICTVLLYLGTVVLLLETLLLSIDFKKAWVGIPLVVFTALVTILTHILWLDERIKKDHKKILNELNKTLKDYEKYLKTLQTVKKGVGHTNKLKVVKP